MPGDDHCLPAFVLLSLYLTHMRRGRSHDTHAHVDVSLSDLYNARVIRVNLDAYDECGIVRTHGVDVPLIERRTVYTFVGVGDVSPWSHAGVARGDACVTVRVLPDPMYTIDDVLCQNDMHLQLRTTLYELFYGTHIPVPHPGGPEWPCLMVQYGASAGDTEDGGSSSSTRVIPGAGLPFVPAPAPDGHGHQHTRGDLYVFFELYVPPALTSEELQDVRTHDVMERLFHRHRRPPPVSTSAAR